MAQTTYDAEPDDTSTQANSNVDGVAPMSGSSSWAPVNVTAAMPPWFVATVSLTARGRGTSTTWKPPACRRQMQTSSRSCHVLTKNRTSIQWSRLTSITSSSLLFSDRTLRHLKFICRWYVTLWRCRWTAVFIIAFYGNKSCVVLFITVCTAPFKV